MKNPFYISGYGGAEYFCDREQEAKRLIENAENGQNSVLYGWRRLGKTALMRHVFDQLGKEWICIRADVYAAIDFGQAVQLIAKAVISEFGGLNKGFSKTVVSILSRLGANFSYNPATGVPSVSFGFSNLSNSDFKAGLDELGNFLGSQKKNVLLAIDEFQVIGTFSEINADALFRDWMQSYPNIRFIYSGSHRQMMLNIFGKKENPFYRSCDLLELNEIPFKIYEPFIKEKFVKAKKNLSNESILEIYEWAMGQTFYVQLICNKLYRRSVKNLDEHLSEAFNESILGYEANFQDVLKALSNLQKRLLVAIAKNDGVKSPTSKDFVAKYELGASSSVGSALKKLRNDEYVVMKGNMYHLQDVLMTRWIQGVF